ncbi:MAG: GNAT family N-acetyltransferase [Bacilli bacterium]|nr:GNAT family N-acetyltransferase [Bacilli bacterium]
MKYILNLLLKIKAMIYYNRHYLLFYIDLKGIMPNFDKKIASNMTFGYTTDVDHLSSLFPNKSKIKKTIEDLFIDGYKCFSIYDKKSDLMGAIWLGFDKDHFEFFKTNKGFRIDPEEYFYIKLFVVKYNCKGKGYGTAMMQMLLDTLTKDGFIKYISAQVYIKNAPSLSCFLKTGFQFYGIHFIKNYLGIKRNSQIILK